MNGRLALACVVDDQFEFDCCCGTLDGYAEWTVMSDVLGMDERVYQALNGDEGYV